MTKRDTGWFPSWRTLKRDFFRLCFWMAWFYFTLGIVAAHGIGGLPPDRQAGVAMVAFAAFLLAVASYWRESEPNG